MDEVGVQDARTNTTEVRADLAEGDGVHVRAEANGVERDAACAQPQRELPRAGLALVEHEEADVPAAIAKIRQNLEEVRLRAGDARDLLVRSTTPSVMDHHPRRVEDATRPRLNRVALGDTLPQSAAMGDPLRRTHRRQRSNPIS